MHTGLKWHQFKLLKKIEVRIQTRSVLIRYHLPSGGTLSACATSSKLNMLVLTPFSLLSCLSTILGILYLYVQDVNRFIV